MNALELAEYFEQVPDGSVFDSEVAYILRRQHAEIQQLKDRLEAAEKDAARKVIRVKLAEPAVEPEGSVCARCGGLVFDPVCPPAEVPMLSDEAAQLQEQNRWLDAKLESHEAVMRQALEALKNSNAVSYDDLYAIKALEDALKCS